MIFTVRVPITTNASGAFTVDTPHINGKLKQVIYDPATGAFDMDTGADVTVAGKVTGLSLLALTNAGTSKITRAPRQPTHDTTGAASLYASGGEPVEAEIAVDEPLTVTVAEGGNTKTGLLQLWFET